MFGPGVCSPINMRFTKAQVCDLNKVNLFDMGKVLGATCVNCFWQSSRGVEQGSLNEHVDTDLEKIDGNSAWGRILGRAKDTRTTSQPTDQATNQPTSQRANQPHNTQRINQPTSQPTNHPTNQPTHQSANQRPNQSSKQLTNDQLLLHVVNYRSDFRRMDCVKRGCGREKESERERERGG